MPCGVGEGEDRRVKDVALYGHVRQLFPNIVPIHVLAQPDHLPSGAVSHLGSLKRLHFLSHLNPV